MKTTRYLSWIKEVGDVLKAQGIVKVPGKVCISVLVARPDKRRRDLDNYLKCVLDALVLNGVIEDDSHVEKLSIEWVYSDNLRGSYVRISRLVDGTESPTRILPEAMHKNGR